MSSGNAHQERLNEELDAAIQENAPSGKLEDVEIQRLVEPSNDASYQRSERVPVKTVEAFEPRSLVSIAMAAQRRRESELRTASCHRRGHSRGWRRVSDATIGSDVEAAGDVALQVDQMVADEAAAPEVSADTSMPRWLVTARQRRKGPERGAVLDIAGRFRGGPRRGLEEGRRVGFDEGQAKGMEEGRTAGRAEASAQLERTVQAFESASARLAELTEVDSGALAASINETILRLASERAGRAIAEQPDSFCRPDRVASCNHHAQLSGQPSIRLNPSIWQASSRLPRQKRSFAIGNFAATRLAMAICR